MGAVMESVFCVAYLVVTFCLGLLILVKAKGDGLKKLFGALTLVWSPDVTLKAGKST